MDADGRAAVPGLARVLAGVASRHALLLLVVVVSLRSSKPAVLVWAWWSVSSLDHYGKGWVGGGVGCRPGRDDSDWHVRCLLWHPEKAGRWARCDRSRDRVTRDTW